jgi:hypothetical protein
MEELILNLVDNTGAAEASKVQEHLDELKVSGAEVLTSPKFGRRLHGVAGSPISERFSLPLLQGGGLPQWKAAMSRLPSCLVCRHSKTGAR